MNRHHPPRGQRDHRNVAGDIRRDRPGDHQLRRGGTLYRGRQRKLIGMLHREQRGIREGNNLRRGGAPAAGSAAELLQPFRPRREKIEKTRRPVMKPLRVTRKSNRSRNRHVLTQLEEFISPLSPALPLRTEKPCKQCLEETNRLNRCRWSGVHPRGSNPMRADKDFTRLSSYG